MDAVGTKTTAEERAKVLAAEKSISLRPGDIPGTVIRIIRDLETAEAERDREAAARRTAELNAAQLDKDLETEVARCARAENLAAEEKAARFITEDRAEQAEAQVATLRTALVALRDLVKEGGVPRYTVTPGAALNTVIEEIVDPALAAIDKAA